MVEHDRLPRLVEEAAADLLAYLARRTRDPEDAADVLGEVFAALAARPERIPADPEGARMWAFGIARRQLDAAFRRRAARSRTVDLLRDQLTTLVHAHPGDDRDAAGRDVRAAVRALPDRQRELVMLVHWDGFSIEDAARHLGIRASTARTHLARGRERLRAVLEPSADAEDGEGTRSAAPGLAPG